MWQILMFILCKQYKLEYLLHKIEEVIVKCNQINYFVTLFTPICGHAYSLTL